MASSSCPDSVRPCSVTEPDVQVLTVERISACSARKPTASRKKDALGFLHKQSCNREVSSLLLLGFECNVITRVAPAKNTITGSIYTNKLQKRQTLFEKNG